MYLETTEHPLPHYPLDVDSPAKAQLSAYAASGLLNQSKDKPDHIEGPIA